MASNRRFLSLVLALWLALFCQTLDAFDLSERRNPQGPLEMRLDYGLASRDRRNWEGGHQWVFSTHITFNGPVTTITDGQLKKLADAAYEEMEVDIQQYDLIIDKKLQKPKMQPGVVTVLAFGNEVILSSSQKGTAAFINEVTESPIRQQMELCRALFTDFNINSSPAQQDHRNGRKCGEVMAFHQYYQLHTQPLQDRTPLARAGTVHRIKSEGNQLKLIDPCGTKEEASIRLGLRTNYEVISLLLTAPTQDRWGCNLMMLNPNGPGRIVNYLPEGLQGEDYDLQNLAGGIREIDQIPMCFLPENRPIRSETSREAVELRV